MSVPSLHCVQLCTCVSLDVGSPGVSCVPGQPHQGPILENQDVPVGIATNFIEQQRESHIAASFFALLCFFLVVRLTVRVKLCVCEGLSDLEIKVWIQGTCEHV